MSQKSLGWVLILVGALLILTGGLAWLGVLSWFGRLPGDVRIERPGFRFYAPLASMLLISILLTVISAILRRFWH